MKSLNKDSFFLAKNAGAIMAKTRIILYERGFIMRKTYCDEGLDMLAQAVVLQAAQDYETALRNKNIGRIRECERFFTSEEFNMYSNANGRYIMEQIKKKVMEEAKRETA